MKNQSSENKTQVHVLVYMKSDEKNLAFGYFCILERKLIEQYPLVLWWGSDLVQE